MKMKMKNGDGDRTRKKNNGTKALASCWRAFQKSGWSKFLFLNGYDDFSQRGTAPGSCCRPARLVDVEGDPLGVTGPLLPRDGQGDYRSPSEDSGLGADMPRSRSRCETQKLKNRSFHHFPLVDESSRKTKSKVSKLDGRGSSTFQMRPISSSTQSRSATSQRPLRFSAQRLVDLNRLQFENYRTHDLRVKTISSRFSTRDSTPREYRRYR